MIQKGQREEREREGRKEEGRKEALFCLSEAIAIFSTCWSKQKADPEEE